MVKKMEDNPKKMTELKNNQLMTDDLMKLDIAALRSLSQNAWDFVRKIDTIIKLKEFQESEE